MLSKINSFDAYLEDTGEARVKIASDNEIEQFCHGLVPDPAFMYLHVIAMGAGDFYGCNKNGDYFPEKSLIMYHHTFEQNAKVYKEHNNKNGAPSYGSVVKSWYNPEMHRVELILAVDKSKAPDIVAKVERGEVPEVSMGARVPHDVCSICGNKASKKSDYCDHIRKELKHVYPDGRQVYMLNLQPTFFDISFVFRRADKLGLMLKKVASDEYTALDHVSDVVEKTADVDKEVPADAVVKVLNKGMFNIMPKLDAIEPDLPPALLDRIASKYSLRDILHSFLHNYVPLKPQEFTRIIIVQNGLPMNSFDDVLSGVIHAEQPQEYPGGEMQSEITKLLNPFMESRSSLGPHVVKRVLVIKKGVPKTAALQNINYSQNVYMEPDRKYRYSTIPVLYDEDEYRERQKELATRSLRKPINPFAVGLTLGSMYLAYRGVNGLQNVVNTLKSDKVMLGAGAATVAAAMALHGDKREKMASYANTASKVLTSTGFTHFVAPFVGAHLASAHYRNKYMRGEDLNGVQMFIAENPDYLSLAAPFAVHYGAKKLVQHKDKVVGAFTDGMKLASDYTEEELNKFADFADTLSQSVLTGIIFKGKNASPLAGVTGALIDNAAYNQFANALPQPEPEKQMQPVPLNQKKIN